MFSPTQKIMIGASSGGSVIAILIVLGII